jgi:CDP-diacylglycerol--glycerol-3-phosphate 3-phosphatidyltransferase
MTFTRLIGVACNKVIRLIVRGLAMSKIHPNFLTLLGLVINVGAAVMLARGAFFYGGLGIIGAGLFDMVDGRVARGTNQVTRFGGFFDSVLDRYSDLALLMGLLVYYGNINRAFYMVLTAIVMTGTVLISYTRARAENIILSCKVGFMERPERVVLLTRAKCRTDRHFARPLDTACQREIRQVRASNQQDHEHRRQQHIQRLTHGLTHEHVRITVHGNPPTLV